MGRQGGAQFNTTPLHPKGKFRDQAFSIVTIVPGKAGSATVISLHLHITCIHYVYIAAPSEMATGATVARLKSLVEMVEDSGNLFFHVAADVALVDFDAQSDGATLCFVGWPLGWLRVLPRWCDC